MYFYDRKDAGQKLGKLLAKKYAGKNCVVYALPRGGVVTGVEIARTLHAPLDLIITRKIGHPYEPEYAIAATAENGHMVGNEQELKAVDKTWLRQTVKKEQQEAKRRRKKYLGNKKPIPVEGKIAILVDDGIATGLTIRVAVLELKHRHPKQIVIAVPIASKTIADAIKQEADEFIALDIPSDQEFLGAIGAYYQEFLPVEDDEVTTLMKKYEKELEEAFQGHGKNKEQLIHINADHVRLEGMLSIPQDAKGLVLFVHGSGSSRLSPRNIYVASVLQESAVATLLIDLLSQEEDEVYATRFDIDLLTERVLTITTWLQKNSLTKSLLLGYFGASTGAAAAIKAAANLGKKTVSAVVSRGGRPDLAENALEQVVSPTLLIVGGDDTEVIGLNEMAFKRLHCIKKLEIVSSATHLFEEPGTLEEVAKLATQWFLTYLQK